MSKTTLRVHITFKGEGSEWGDQDTAGWLEGPNGEKLSEHYSSSLEWLKGDLTTQFRDRKARLDELFPDGYELEIVDDTNLADPQQGAKDE